MPEIMSLIKNYCDMTGKTLREVFNKTKAGQDDVISKFDFTRTMTDIFDMSGQQVDLNSIDRFVQEFDF